MKKKLTEEMEAQLSMAMRVVEFMQKNIDFVKGNSEMLEAFNDLSAAVPEILDQLDGEELNMLLERYKNELAFLRKQNPGLSI